MNPKIAIIGGSGVQDPGIFKKEREMKIKTPFGCPSAPIMIGDFLGPAGNVSQPYGKRQKIAFLARHGQHHQFPPHKVPQRANIWALKKIGVERIIGICAVGSLKENFKPGEIVICDQSIDFTKNREYTIYDGAASLASEKKVMHVSSADPFCPELREVFFREARKLKIPAHKTGTYLCIEGPRFSTKAESKFFRNFADIVGMTLAPEAVLARELEICYLSLGMVTDYDVWRDTPVSADEVIKTMKNNLEKIKKLLENAIPKIKGKRNCFCKESLKNAKI